MLTTATEIDSDNHRDMYISQHLDESPGETSYGSQIAPQSKSVVWEVHETIDGFVVKPLSIHRIQESAAGTYTTPSNMPIPDHHYDAMKKRLIFKLPIKSTAELTMLGLDGKEIDNEAERKVIGQ